MGCHLDWRVEAFSALSPRNILGNKGRASAYDASPSNKNIHGFWCYMALSLQEIISHCLIDNPN